jgi:hypothetical protein
VHDRLVPRAPCTLMLTGKGPETHAGRAGGRANGLVAVSVHYEHLFSHKAPVLEYDQADIPPMLVKTSTFTRIHLSPHVADPDDTGSAGW